MLIRKIVLSTVAAVAMAGTEFAAAPQQATNAETTITGCLYREKDVPSRAPNVAERVGLGEDYILAEMSAAEVAKPADARVPTTYSMYKLEGPADTQLKAAVGKRIQVTGVIKTEPKDTTGQPAASAKTNKTDQVIGHDRINLAEIKVSKMTTVSGSCPATPTSTQ